MATLYGAVLLADVAPDQTYLGNPLLDQETLWDVTATAIAQHNADLALQASLFVGEDTTNATERYDQSGGGTMQLMGEQSQPAAVKAGGGFDVGYPIQEWADQIAAGDIAWRYMALTDYQRHVQTILNRDANTRRQAIMRSLFRNTPWVFRDATRRNAPSVTVKSIANGDGDTYMSALGSLTEATDNHFLTSGYLATAISNINDPYPVLVGELSEHQGRVTGGQEIVVFINAAQAQLTRALAAFVPVANRFVTPGVNDDTVNAAGLGIIPTGMTAEIIGVHSEAGCAIAVWDAVPAGYMVAVHRGMEPTLKRRVDISGVGIPIGLHLVREGPTSPYPFINAFWRNRYGYGVYNRIGVAIMQLTAGAYVIPAVYA